jgi:hypothetical protein
MLSDLDLAVLAMERRTFRFLGSKDEAVTVELGMTPTRYYQYLRALIDRPEALEVEPVLVNRLRRLRQSRRQQRAS